jgi:hypothetical protein
MSDQIRVNGNLVGWSSCILKIDGEKVVGVTSINWDESLESTMGYGMGRSHAPIAQTPGKYVPGALKIRLWSHTAIAWRKKLAAKARDKRSFGTVYVPVFFQVDEGEIVSTVEFRRCRVSKVTPGVEEGAEGMVEEWEFTNQGIITDDTTLYDSSQG